jgi:hypothetical protein
MGLRGFKGHIWTLEARNGCQVMKFGSFGTTFLFYSLVGLIKADWLLFHSHLMTI